MGTQTKGFCKYCGKEYTRSGMLRHLEACKERKSKLVQRILSFCYIDVE